MWEPHSSIILTKLQVLERYQEIPAGSRASKLPLLELIVVAVHTIAVELFELDEGSHRRDTPCTSYKDGEVPRIKPWPTMFAVRAYTNTKQFSRGVADVAGYWAEDIIFGGVVLFGRGESGIGVSGSSLAKSRQGCCISDMHFHTVQHDGVWFDSHRIGVTYRIYALTDKQLESLLHFLEWEPKPQVGQQAERPECPLPILGGDENLTRVDPEVAMPLHNIFRDRWEQAISWGSYSEYKMVVKSRPSDAFNYPEIKKKRRMPTGGDSNGQPRLTLGDCMMMRRRKDEGSAPQPHAHDMDLEQTVPEDNSTLPIPSPAAKERDEPNSLD